jgi:hypothetical protein
MWIVTIYNKTIIVTEIDEGYLVTIHDCELIKVTINKSDHRLVTTMITFTISY